MKRHTLTINLSLDALLALNWAVNPSICGVAGVETSPLTDVENIPAYVRRAIARQCDLAEKAERRRRWEARAAH